MPATLPCSTSDAWHRFDALPPVELDFMLGEWLGSGYPTGHPMDGLLEAFHWQGKRFDSTEDVHPLVFRTRQGRAVSVNPLFMAPAVGLLERPWVQRTAVLGAPLQWLLPCLQTRRSRARLRMTTHRGCTTATMVYDQLPIHDVFRKIDDHTVLGVMDLKGMRQPFFFLLRRAGAR